MTLETPMVNAPEELDELTERTDEAVEKTAEATRPDISLKAADKAIEKPKDQTEPQKPAFDLDKLSGLVDKKRASAPSRFNSPEYIIRLG